MDGANIFEKFVLEVASKEEAITAVSQEIAATTAGDELLVRGPHLLLHRDNLTVPLLVNALDRQTLSPLTDPELKASDEDQNALESRKLPSSVWPRKIGRVSLIPKIKESIDTSSNSKNTPSSQILLAMIVLANFLSIVA
ncbi:uncharacterized protein LOC125179267 [Hyalella azteca]|uniref:Uncharacterized protein LOC125179267 n=1 Tax=Hyalella azteca TaxID=294128 RepID=A0A979FU77_HYAAZ|nr:uncharacterized protein LOC125179267 [Hyalella azteca]